MKLLKEMNEEKETNQMSLISDTDEVVKFLEFAGKKSILNEHTINCRLTACNNLFSILNEGEDNIEYMIHNLDLLVNRFRNKNNSVQPSTLKVYKSRVKSSLEDFQAWSKDPIAWEKSVTDKSKVTVKERKTKAAGAAPKTRRSVEIKDESPRASVSSDEAKSVFPKGARKVSFPIRADFNLEMVIPHDGLSMKELLRLGLFLYPYCKDSDTRDESLPWSNLPRVTN